MTGEGRQYGEAHTMRILHLASEYPPQKIYGLGRAVRELAVAQAALGHQVHVVTNSMSGSDHEVEDEGVLVHRVHFPPPPKPADEVTTVVQFNLQVIERVAHARLAEGVEVVHSHDWLTGLAGIAVGSMLGAPLAITVHDTAHGKALGEFDPSRVYVMDLERHAFGQANLLVCPSRFIAREVATAYGVSGRRVAIVPQGVRAPEAAGEPEPGTILFIGRLDPEKGVGVLLLATRDLLAAHPNARVLVAGTGKLEEELKRQAQPLGDAVEFLGYVADPGPLYRKAEVVVVPSLYEPFGLVALEAMACGRPVVASATGGLAEIITDGNDGVLVPPGDARALAMALSRVLSDEELAARLGQAARATCAERFTWAAAAQGYMAAYHRMLREPATVLLMADDPTHPLAQEALEAWQHAEIQGLRVVREAENPDLVHVLRTRPEPPKVSADVPVVQTVLSRDAGDLTLDGADHVVFAWHDASLDRHEQLVRRGLARTSQIYPAAGVGAAVSPPDRDALRQRLGLPTERPVVGLFGPAEAHREALVARAPSVLVLEPTEDQFAALDVAVCPEPRDELFRSLVLCSLQGVPLVGPRRGLLAELTEDGFSGMLNDGSPEACADAVAGLLADPERRRDLGRMAREIAHTRFGANVCLDRYAQLFDRLLGQQEADDALFLSIVIDVRDRREALLRGLETLLCQSASPDAYEIVIVDYGGTDGLEAVLPDDPRIRHIYSHHRDIYSHGRARNIGIRAARGQAVTCVDADLLFPPHLVEALLALHGTDDSLAVYADVFRLDSETQELLVSGQRSPTEGLRWLRDHARNHFRQAPCGGLQSASRWAWESIRGYDEDYVGYGMEDVDLADRFRAVGLHTVFHPEVYVVHQHHGHPNQYRTRAIDRRNHTLYARRRGQAIRNQGEAWGRRRPRPVPTGMPRVLLVADEPGWALDSIASAIASHLGDRFRFQTLYRHPFDPSPIDAEAFDLVYLLFSGIWVPRAEDDALAGKAVVGVHSHAELHPAAWQALARCRAVCAVSRRLFWECAERLPVPVAYTPSGVDVDLFRPRPRVPNPRFRVGWAGSLGPHRANKGVEEFLIPAVEALANVDLVLATREHDALSPPEMVDFYNSLDCYVCTSAHEGEHLPLLEAGACGLPLISTDVGIAPELIEPGRNGLIVERSVEHIRRAIDLLARNPDLAREMGRRNRRLVVESWSWEVLAARYARLFSALLDEQATGLPTRTALMS